MSTIVATHLLVFFKFEYSNDEGNDDDDVHVQKQSEDIVFQRVTIDPAHLQHCVNLRYINVGLLSNHAYAR